MVVGDGAAGGTIDGGGGVSGGVVPGAEPLDEDDPTRLGPYVLLGRLGQGGMGTVYLGRRESPATTGPGVNGGASAGPAGTGLVAVKVIRPDLAREPEFRERFGREATAARRVARFCTAEVLDVDVESRRPYLVTEFIDGRTLAAAVRADGPLPSAEVERLAVAVASALTAIHAAGLVHRDLKPGNIMLSPSGARVIDFGIARALDAATTFTHAGVGTPAFMAPEQALGGVVAPPADVYAWGGVVVFAATGRLPHGDGPSPVVLYRAVNEEPDLTGVGPGLRRLVARAMAKDPARRPTAQDLLLRLVGAGDLDDLDDDPDGRDASARLADASGRQPEGTEAGGRAPAATDGGADALTLATQVAADIGADHDGARAASGDAPTAGTPSGGPGAPAGPSSAAQRARPAARPRPGRPTSTDPPTREATTVVPIHLRPELASDDDGFPARLPHSAGPARRHRLPGTFGVLRRGPGATARGGGVDATPLGEPLVGHTGPVQAVTFSPDGRAVATASADGTARLWRLPDPRGLDVLDGSAPPQRQESATRQWPDETLRGHEGRVLGVAFRADGRVLATSGSDHTVRLWRWTPDDPSDARPVAAPAPAAGYQPLATGRGHTDQVVSVTFARRGRLLATAGLDGTARLWEVDAEAAGNDAIRAVGRPLTGHQGKVLAVAFTPDGQTLATAGTDHTVLLWDLTSSVPRPLGHPLTEHRWHVRSLAFSPDGAILAVGAGFGTVRLWGLADRARPVDVARLAGRQNAQVRSVAFSADGRTLAAAAAGIGGSVQLWDVADPAAPDLLGPLPAGPVETVRSVAFSPAADILATAADTSVHLWQPA